MSQPNLPKGASESGIYIIFVPWTADDTRFDNPTDAEEYVFQKANEVRASRGLKVVPKDKLRISWDALGKSKTFYYGTKIFGVVTVQIGCRYGDRGSFCCLS